MPLHSSLGTGLISCLISAGSDSILSAETALFVLWHAGFFGSLFLPASNNLSNKKLGALDQRKQIGGQVQISVPSSSIQDHC